jgi:hypothetical protein
MRHFFFLQTFFFTSGFLPRPHLPLAVSTVLAATPKYSQCAAGERAAPRKLGAACALF